MRSYGSSSTSRLDGNRGSATIQDVEALPHAAQASMLPGWAPGGAPDPMRSRKVTPLPRCTRDRTGLRPGPTAALSVAPGRHMRGHTIKSEQDGGSETRPARPASNAGEQGEQMAKPVHLPGTSRIESEQQLTASRASNHPWRIISDPPPSGLERNEKKVRETVDVDTPGSSN
jgi:hypothetical protein